MTETAPSSPLNQFMAAFLKARQCVYRAGSPTPLQPITLTLPSGDTFDMFVKREDLGPINAYKWRGAFNAVSARIEGNPDITEVVAASAGNHAQGVALAARQLGLRATIFMPTSTPQMKQDAVKRHGNGMVDIRLIGDTFDAASDAARAYTAQTGATFIHPFDDIDTIAGQATIADEIVMAGQAQPFDIAFLQIGGGGMAAGVAMWLKQNYPSIQIIGVEGVDQASMKASIEAGMPVTLERVDAFCDGTAVKRPGDLTFGFCRQTLDGIVTVTNEAVSAAMRQCWNAMRVIPEPSGAMGLAGALAYAEQNPGALAGKRVVSVLTGANMDFSKLGLIASQAAAGAGQRTYLRFELSEGRGNLLSLLEQVFADVNVTDFQYGQTARDIAHPVIAFDASPERLQALEARLQDTGIPYENVTGDADTRYRIIPYNPDLFGDAEFYHIHFPERSGALRELLRRIRDVGEICYFNYSYTGEQIGRTLMAFKTDDKARLDGIIKSVVVDARPLDAGARARILGGTSAKADISP